MSEEDFSTRAAELRQSFDATFARLPDDARASTHDFLIVRLAGDPFALRVRDFVRVAAAPKILSVPSRRATVMGVAAIRGVVVSVHSLAKLLGHDASLDAPKWIGLARGAETIGLAFGELERFVRVNATEERVLVHEGIARPIIDVATILESVKTEKRREA